MRSKEDVALKPFLNSSKYWYFDALLHATGMSRSQLSQWLKKFMHEGIITRVKPKRKMPYYVQNADNPTFQQRKRLFALQQLVASGLLSHLATLPGAKVVILFGSFSRYDWHEGSDIDIFIYGDDELFEQGKYELLLQRDIQVHIAKNKDSLKKMEKMLPYVVSGDFIKGSIDDLGVEMHAKV